MNIEDTIKTLDIWENKISLKKITGGITNQNFQITDGSKKYFLRNFFEKSRPIFSQNFMLCARVFSILLQLSP